MARCGEARTSPWARRVQREVLEEGFALDWSGWAGRGVAWKGKPGFGEARLGEARRAGEWQSLARRGMARVSPWAQRVQRETLEERFDLTWSGWARLGKVRFGKARHGFHPGAGNCSGFSFPHEEISMAGKKKDVVGDPTNGGEESILASAPYTVRVQITGSAKLLFHRWNCESIEAKAAAAKNSAAKRTDDTASYVYRDDDGNLCIPGEYLRQATIAASARHVPRLVCGVRFAGQLTRVLRPQLGQRPAGRRRPSDRYRRLPADVWPVQCHPL